MVKPRHRKIARRRIVKLFAQARQAALEDRLDRANRYVAIARRMGMRYNVSLPSELRRRICSRCYSYMYPGTTCRVRLNRGKLVTRCHHCGYINRYVYER